MERQVACQGFGGCVLHTDASGHGLGLQNVKCLGYSECKGSVLIAEL